MACVTSTHITKVVVDYEATGWKKKKHVLPDITSIAAQLYAGFWWSAGMVERKEVKKNVLTLCYMHQHDITQHCGAFSSFL